MYISRKKKNREASSFLLFIFCYLFVALIFIRKDIINYGYMRTEKNTAFPILIARNTCFIVLNDYENYNIQYFEIGEIHAALFVSNYVTFIANK